MIRPIFSHSISSKVKDATVRYALFNSPRDRWDSRMCSTWVDCISALSQVYGVLMHTDLKRTFFHVLNNEFSTRYERKERLTKQFQKTEWLILNRGIPLQKPMCAQWNFDSGGEGGYCTETTSTLRTIQRWILKYTAELYKVTVSPCEILIFAFGFFNDNWQDHCGWQMRSMASCNTILVCIEPNIFAAKKWKSTSAGFTLKQLHGIPGKMRGEVNKVV